MVNRIGFIGLGNMGVPMVRNLAAAGVPVAALDQAADRRALLDGVENVTTTGRLADLAECDQVILMLPNGNIVREILIGDGGLGGQLQEGALVIDMSSSDPIAYDDIVPMLSARNIDIVDAPVSGNVSGAKAGTLTIMAGGTERAVSRARPTLERLGKQLFHTGALGTGQVMKALNNLLSAGGLIMAAEVLLTAKAAGLDPSQVNDILNVSTGRNNSTERKIAPFVLSGAYNSGFGLSLMAKDLRTAANVADRLGMVLPLSSHAVSAAVTASEELGPVADHTEVARWIEEVTGRRFQGS